MSVQAQALCDRAHKEKPVLLHIRRTDYAKYKGGKLLGLSYYNEALSIMKNCFHRTGPIWVFSDDIAFCKEIFKNTPNVVYPSKTAPSPTRRN